MVANSLKKDAYLPRKTKTTAEIHTELKGLCVGTTLDLNTFYLIRKIHKEKFSWPKKITTITKTKFFYIKILPCEPTLKKIYLYIF